MNETFWEGFQKQALSDERAEIIGRNIAIGGLTGALGAATPGLFNGSTPSLTRAAYGLGGGMVLGGLAGAYESPDAPTLAERLTHARAGGQRSRNVGLSALMGGTLAGGSAALLGVRSPRLLAASAGVGALSSGARTALTSDRTDLNTPAFARAKAVSMGENVMLDGLFAGLQRLWPGTKLAASVRPQGWGNKLEKVVYMGADELEKIMGKVKTQVGESKRKTFLAGALAGGGGMAIINSNNQPQRMY